MNLHTTDLPLEINREFYDDLIENFEAIEHEDQQDDAQLTQEINDRKDADSHLQDQIDKINIHLDDLDETKATHDDVGELRDEMYQIRDNWNDRASHIARGTDIETTKAVVEQILQEKGLI
ncbi:hypothetical protein [Limosilactobacillus fermentum]|uniref:hypothetical protein n=1 Tax=Limosilactobacillus fermentum TaxID=1613 RepID=UPI000FECD12F|nr:hypothetical protein [Limosilactobacillus fermentum]QAR22463.1 hypothetical protein EQG50_08380 [Limosilactobacillus fermentum]